MSALDVSPGRSHMRLQPRRVGLLSLAEIGVCREVSTGGMICESLAPLLDADTLGTATALWVLPGGFMVVDVGFIAGSSGGGRGRG